MLRCDEVGSTIVLIAVLDNNDGSGQCSFKVHGPTNAFLWIRLAPVTQSSGRLLTLLGFFFEEKNKSLDIVVLLGFFCLRIHPTLVTVKRDVT